MKILIKNCNLISVSNKRERYEENIDILINNNIIEKIGKNIKEKSDKIIDAQNKIVMPGLINTHTHIAMSIFRDTLDGYGLQNWLSKKIWPMESKLTREDIYYASYLSCMEMIRTGTTTFNDQYFMAEATIDAVLKTGLNAHLSRCLMDFAGPGERMTELENLIKNYKNTENITINVGIHSLYTCTEKMVKEAAELCKKNNMYVHMHFAENSKEMEDIKKIHNSDNPIDLIDKYFNGMKLVLAHGVKLSEEDIKKLDSKNISISHCPVSNLRLGCGIAKINSYIKNKVNVSLGTDGQGSGSNLDMFETMKLTALLQKGINEDAELMHSYEVITMATINGAKALGIDKKAGSIDEGKNADLIIVNLDQEVNKPVNDVFSNIVYNAKGSNVVTTISNGKILMENNKICIEEEKDIYDKCQKILERIK